MLVGFRPDIEGTVHLIPLLEALRVELGAWYRPLRRPSPAFQEAVDHTLRVVTLNLIAASSASVDAWVVLHGKKVWYQENRVLVGSRITHASVGVVCRFLRAHGYAIFRKGRASSHKAFRRPNVIKVGAKLLHRIRTMGVGAPDTHSDPAAFPIRLKSKRDERGSARYLPTPINTETAGMMERLARINWTLLRNWPDLELTDRQHDQMMAHIEASEGEERLVDLGRRTLYRVFNNGTLEEGGRFYGGWWQDIPKVYRPYITINGKRTVEIDYSAIHPTFLFHEVKLQKPDDPYDIGLGNRDLVKRTFNALINAKGTSIRPVEAFDPALVGMTWKEFLHHVKVHFAPFRMYFGTGYGLKLQKLDSDIAECVMLHFAHEGYPVLPVHDSFIVHHGLEAELVEVMEKAFLDRTGATISLKRAALAPETEIEISSRREVEYQRLLDTGLSEIAALLSTRHSYGKYESRLDRWFAMRASMTTTTPLPPYMEPPNLLQPHT